MSSATLTDDLMAYWRFDEGTGSVANSQTGIGNMTLGTGAYSWNNFKLPSGSGFEPKSINITGVNTRSNTTQLDLSGINKFAWSTWINYTGGGGYVFIQGTAADRWRLQTVATGFIQFQVGTTKLNYPLSVGRVNHIVAMANVTNMYLWVNGTLVNETSTPDIHAQADLFTMGNDYNGGVPLKAGLDEVGYWNRTLTDEEINILYNSGNGKPYPFQLIQLNSPENDATLIDDIIYFNSTLIGTSIFEISNATLNIWNSTSDLINSTTNEITGASRNTTVFGVSMETLGTYTWNVYGCFSNTTDVMCEYADVNRTFDYSFIENSYTYNSTVIETTTNTFSIDLSLPQDVSIQTAILQYNGTNYTNADKNNYAGNNWTLSKTITIPSGILGFSAENRTFNWIVTLSDTDTGLTLSRQTSDLVQEVKELSLALCGGSNNIAILNFTLFDEMTGNEINAVTNATDFEATFYYGASSNNFVKNYSIVNQSVNVSQFDFCTNVASAVIYTDMVAEYDAVGYSQSNHYLSNANLNNVTNEVALYLLPETESVQFFISVTRDLVPLGGATVNIDKFFVGEGVYKTVEIDEADNTGKLTAYLELDQKYRFVVYKDGQLLGTKYKTSSCEAAPCTININVESASQDIFSGYTSAFAANVVYNLSYDSTTKIVTFDFIDTTGLATSFKMDVLSNYPNQTRQSIISSQRVYTSSGTITYNASLLNDGEYIVNTYISRSPDQFIDFIIFIVSSVAKELGLLGLVIALVLVLVIVLGISYNPFLFVFAIPLSLTIAKMGNIIYLKSSTLIGIYILAFIAVIAMGRK